MNLDTIQSVTLSLLKKESDTNEMQQAEYSKKLTAKFTVPADFPRSEDTFSTIIKDMYEDLLKNAPSDADAIGIWIDNGSIILDNALTLETLSDIKMYSRQDINVAYEFFKMTMMLD